ncbi:MAG: hypothetical protein K2X03_02485 [Bryobacteraceae bacterium]|nr:hypothetical protein [Bryobacteraceae bacterium]
MLVSALGFGSIWTRRSRKDAGADDEFSPRQLAYYNTTGVAVGGRIRSRPRLYGVARFNGVTGCRPDSPDKMLNKVFDCEPPCIWNGHPKILFNRLLERPERPDAYLVVVKSGLIGGITNDGTWLAAEASVISFSECGSDQEVMVLMPPFGWLRGGVGTLFLEPAAGRPWQAHWAVSTVA